MLNTLAGIIASSGGAVGGDFESIATVTVGSGGASSISFTSIPSTYKHLQIRWLARSSDAASVVNLTTQLNGDTGSNYAWHRIFGNGTSVGAGGSATQTNAIIGQITGASTSANIFGVGVLDILDYSNTNKYKTIRALTGQEDNSGTTNSNIQLWSGLWQSTNANSSITFSSGGGFAQYSSFALYGIKG
jgi:hypothetical protein